MIVFGGSSLLDGITGTPLLPDDGLEGGHV